MHNYKSLEQVLARQRSFTTQAVIAALLLLLFLLPGWIAAEAWSREARRVERTAGKRLPGAQALHEIKLLARLGAALLVLLAAAALIAQIL